MKLFLILSLMIGVSLACTGLENRRTCTCQVHYSANNTKLSSLALPLDYYEDCDLNLGCEKAPSCQAFCLRQAQHVLDPASQSTISQTAKDMACRLIASNQSLTGVAEGLRLVSLWKYEQCSNGESVIMEGVCCKKRCKCEIVGQRFDNSDGDGVEVLWDLSEQVDVGNLAYDCNKSEFNDCERGCRQVVGDRLGDDKIKSMLNRKEPSYSLFGNRKSLVASERVCSESAHGLKGNFDVFVKVATDLAKFDSQGKFLPLGQLCCRRTCKCELLSQDALIVSSAVRQKSKLLADLSHLVREKSLSYDCTRSRENCLKDCREALCEFFQSEVIRNNATTVDWATTDLDVFSENVSGVRVCEEIRQDLKPPGLNVYLRARLNEEKDFPEVEDMHVGRICCFPFIGKVGDSGGY